MSRIEIQSETTLRTQKTGVAILLEGRDVHASQIDVNK